MLEWRRESFYQIFELAEREDGFSGNLFTSSERNERALIDPVQLCAPTLLKATNYHFVIGLKLTFYFFSSTANQSQRVLASAFAHSVSTTLKFCLENSFVFRHTLGHYG